MTWRPTSSSRIRWAEELLASCYAWTATFTHPPTWPNTANPLAHFPRADPPTAGRVPIPLATNTDSNDDGAGTGMPLSGVTITIGATSQDIGDGNGSQPYGVIIDGNGNTCANVYKHLKYVVSKAHAAGAGRFTTLGYF